MANPWRRFRSMLRGPAAPLPPPTEPAPSAPPSTHLTIPLPTVKPISWAASPPPRPEPRREGEPVAVPPPTRETYPRRDTTAPLPPPPAITLAQTTGSVLSSPAPRPVAAAQVPAVSAAIAKNPMTSPRVSAPTSPIKTRTGSAFSSATAVPVPASAVLSSKPEVEAEARAVPQSPETRLVTPRPSPSDLPSPWTKTTTEPKQENVQPANPGHKHNGGGEMEGELARETRRHELGTGIVDAQKKMKDRTLKSTPPPLRAFVNSNVQGMNNSIVFDSSCTHHDPGVHISDSRNPSLDGKGHHI